MKNFGILLLAMVSCCLLQAKDRVVKQPPFIARSSSTIEIPFERYARKYGINYALKKDKSKEPPVYLVFFKGRDQDALNAAFREFSQKQIQKANKPSIHKRLAAYRAMMPKKSKDKVKNRHQEQSR